MRPALPCFDRWFLGSHGLFSVLMLSSWPRSCHNELPSVGSAQLLGSVAVSEQDASKNMYMLHACDVLRTHRDSAGGYCLPPSTCKFLKDDTWNARYATAYSTY